MLRTSDVTNTMFLSVWAFAGAAFCIMTWVSACLAPSSTSLRACMRRVGEVQCCMHVSERVHTCAHYMPTHAQCARACSTTCAANAGDIHAVSLGNLCRPHAGFRRQLLLLPCMRACLLARPACVWEWVLAGQAGGPEQAHSPRPHLRAALWLPLTAQSSQVRASSCPAWRRVQ